jgi:protein-disulfide isomerase
MLKLAIAAAALSAVGATAYVVHASRAGSPATSSAASPGEAPVAALAIARAPAAGPRAAIPRPSPSSVDSVARAPGAPADPEAAEAAGGSGCDPARGQAKAPSAPGSEEDGDVVPAATIARLGLERGPSRGAPAAPVAIAVFTDPMCHFCGAALGLLDQLLDEYAGKVRLIVKQMPLRPATEALSQGMYAAEAQGKFWELHDLMLAHQDELTKDLMYTLARQAGLDAARLRAAVEQGTYRAAVDADKAAAAELGVRGTPAFFINGHRVAGMHAPADFRAVIDRALAERR